MLEQAGRHKRSPASGSLSCSPPFEIGASIAIFAHAVDHGASDVAAYLWACLGPLIGAVAYLGRTHDLSGASIAILAFNAYSALIAMIGRTDATMLLYKDSFATRHRWTQLRRLAVLRQAVGLLVRPTVRWWRNPRGRRLVGADVELLPDIPPSSAGHHHGVGSHSAR